MQLKITQYDLEHRFLISSETEELFRGTGKALIELFTEKRPIEELLKTQKTLEYRIDELKNCHPADFCKWWDHGICRSPEDLGKCHKQHILDCFDAKKKED